MLNTNKFHGAYIVAMAWGDGGGGGLIRPPLVIHDSEKVKNPQTVCQEFPISPNKYVNRTYCDNVVKYVDTELKRGNVTNGNVMMA